MHIHIAKMLETNTLGDSNPKALIHSLWLVCTTKFGMRTGQETYNLIFNLNPQVQNLLRIPRNRFSQQHSHRKQKSHRLKENGNEFERYRTVINQFRLI